MYVTDDGEVGVLEDRRVRVLVDGDDGAGALHADLVLDRARDPARDIELRRDRLPGLADLGRVRIPACVHYRPGRGDRASEGLGEILDQRETLGLPEPASSRHDHVGVLDRGALAFLVRLLDHDRLLGEVLDLDRDLGHLCTAAGLGRLECARADEREARLALPADLRDHGVAERGPLADEPAVPELEIDEIPVETRVEARG